MTQRYFMQHKGKSKVTSADVTHTVIDPDTGEERIVIDEKGKTETIDLAPGSAFGDFPVGPIIEVRDPKLRAILKEKGFEHVDLKGKAAKEAEESAVQNNGLSGRLAQIAERDRQRALGKVRNLPGADRDLAPEALKEKEKETPPETIGSEGGK